MLCRAYKLKKGNSLSYAKQVLPHYVLPERLLKINIDFGKLASSDCKIKKKELLTVEPSLNRWGKVMKVYLAHTQAIK